MPTKFITEVMQEINKDPNLLHTDYKKFGDGGPLGTIFKHAFLPEEKFDLPDGEPPFQKAKEPIGMTAAKFIQEVRKFYVFRRSDLKAIRREQIFIQLLESIHPDEAKILIAIKDQNLTKLYPNITHDVLAAAGFLPPKPAAVQVEEQKTPKKARKPRTRGESENPQSAQSSIVTQQPEAGNNMS